MRCAILAAVLAAACGIACAEEDTNLYYRVLSCVAPHGFRHDYQPQINRDIKKGLAELYKVEWPAGSEAIYVSQSDQLIVRNTLSNLNVLTECLASHLRDQRIGIEYQVFAFRLSDVEQLLTGPGVSCETLMALRENGKAKLVTTARTVAQSGQQTVAKNVVEVLYPTEMDSDILTNQTGAAWTIVPSNFETREVGTILEAASKLVDDPAVNNQISIILNPQWVTLNRWEQFEAGSGDSGKAGKVPMRQPVFEVSSIQTHVYLRSGETVLLGGSKASEGDWVQYHFIKAELVLPK